MRTSAGLIAALGVTSIVIGLALQNAVGGVISGLLLLFEQPFKIGDWLDRRRRPGPRGRGQLARRAHRHRFGHPDRPELHARRRRRSPTSASRPGAFHATATVKFTTDDPPHEVIGLLLEVADALPMRVAGRAGVAPSTRAPARTPSMLPVSGPARRQPGAEPVPRRGSGTRPADEASRWTATRPIRSPSPAGSKHALDVVGPTLHLGDDERDAGPATRPPRAVRHR